MARHLRKRNDTKAALWRDACGRALVRRLWKGYDASSTEALCRVDYGDAMALRLRKRYAAAPAEALWRGA